MPTKTRRALLFIPGDDRRKIEKGASLDVDTVILDIEDGVALNNKDTARSTIRSALGEVTFGHTERLVRTNAVTDEHHAAWETDIAQTIEGHPDGYILPKIERAEQVQRAAESLAKAERNYGWLDGSIRLLAIVETAIGIINLKAIANSSSRLAALIFGAEDLVSSIGATRTPDGWEVFYARSAVVLHAKAYGLQAIDTPFVDLTADDSMLISETEQALYMGYTGKLAIHPRQIKPIQSVFTPKPEQIRQAKRLIEVFEEHQAAGKGVFELDGKMVDMPMVRAARSVLARAKAANIDVQAL